MRCYRCNKEFYSEDISRTLCDECLGKGSTITSYMSTPSIYYQNILLVEDGSVDTAKLDEMGIKYIIYRQGSQKPEIIKLWESMK